MIIDLSGKTALVTGSTEGIGYAIAKGLAQAGATVLPSAALQGSSVRLIRSSTRLSSLARDSFITRCFGPVASAVMNGRLISVSIVVESSIFARSAASFRR